MTRITEERGSALVAGMIISALVLTLGATALGISVHTNKASVDERVREQAFHAADAGISQAIERFTYDFVSAGSCGAPPTDPVELATDDGVIASYRYEIVGIPSDPGCTTNYRRIRSWGYVSRATPVVRQLEVDVEVLTVGGFDFTLFAGGPSGQLSLQNNVAVTGSVYAEDLSATMNNFAQPAGNVVTPGDLTTINNALFGGDVTAGGSIDMGAANQVSGNVRAAKGTLDIGNGTVIQGYGRAGGAITVGPTTVVRGGTMADSPSSPPQSIPLPTFTFDPSDYAGPIVTFTSVAEANAYFMNGSGSALAGTFHVTDPFGGTIDLRTCRKIVGDVTIVADVHPVTGAAPSVRLSNGPPVCSWTSTDDHRFVVVSMVDPGSVGIRTTTPWLSLPTTLCTLFFTPGEVSLDAAVLQFKGGMYADAITGRNGVNVTECAELASDPPPGFDFSGGGGQWDVQPLGNGWNEVPATGLPGGSL